MTQHVARTRSSSENLLEVRDLSTSFMTDRGTVTAVDQISLTVRPGEIVGIVGESGSGKSVTAASIMRLLDERETTYGGEVILDGTDLLPLPENQMREIRGARVAMVFQDPMTSLNPLVTVGRQIVEAIRLHTSASRAEAKAEAVSMLARTGIHDAERRFHDYPHQLSGGMRQRVMIAMALTCKPDLLIADEPTTALDVTTQAQILDLIRELRDEFGMGTILITHDLGVVANTCDRVAVMYLGQIVEEASVEDLFAAPRHPYTRGLMRAMPSFDLGVDRSRDRLYDIPGSVPPLTAVPKGCRFNPRCSFATDECRSTAPVLEPAGSGKVRCLRWTELPPLTVEETRG